MADASTVIFNKKAAEKLRSPDDLDKYVRVTNPSVWLILVACMALLAGLLAWGVFGSVTTSVSTTGAVVDISALSKTLKDKGVDDPASVAAVCFLSAEDVANVEVGDVAQVGGEPMVVQYIAPVPNAPDEWDGLIGSEYLVKTLFDGDWAYPIIFQGDVSQLDEGVPVSITITTSRVAPISLILKNWG